MTSFATGGKVWKIPTDITTAKNKIFVKELAKHSIGMLPLCYMMFAGLFFLTFIGMSIIFGIAFFSNTNYQQFMNADGGIIINQHSKEISPSPLTFALILLAPYTISFIINFLEYKTSFSNLTINQAGGVSFAFIATMLITASVVILLDSGYFIVDAPNYDSIVSWMNDRYGFEPYNRPTLTEALNGTVMYPENTDFPLRDVYLKENDGAYFLLDATGKELPVKN